MITYLSTMKHTRKNTITSKNFFIDTVHSVHSDDILLMYLLMYYDVFPYKLIISSKKTNPRSPYL